MRFPNWLVRPFTIAAERYYPDPLIFAVLVTIITFLLALLMTDSSPDHILLAWGEGLPKLLTFMAQLSLTLLGAHALANTDSVRRILFRVGSLPRSEVQAYALVVFVASVGSLFAWALGLVVGAIMAKQVALACQHKGLRVHYPLLVASAYAGFVVWHMGYSSSAALFVATPGHALEAAMGILPVTETILTLSNVLIALATIIAIAIACPMMRPKSDEIIEIDAGKLFTAKAEPLDNSSIPITPAQHLDRARVLSLILGLALLGYIFSSMNQKGFYLDLNIVNWSFIGLALILARSPVHFVGLINEASGTIGPILIQYPFYAGIMGIMAGTGLAGVMSDWFASFSSADTLGLIAFLSAGLLNLFIPSGGGQWAVQGPVFIEAANQLGVQHSVIVMAIAYGDQWTNMIQPLFTIPLLAIAGLGLRQIMGYTVVIFFITMIIFGGGLLLIGAG